MQNERDLTQEFSIAAQQRKEQLQRQEEQKRIEEIKRLKNENDRREHEQMVQMRDLKLKLEEDRARKEEEAVVQRELQKRAQAREQLNLTMQRMKGKDPQQIEREVRAAVRAVHGAELDNHRDDFRATMNREIDASLKETQEKERAQERHNQMKENSRDVTKESLKRPWESAQENKRPWESNLFGRDGGRSRERD